MLIKSRLYAINTLNGYLIESNAHHLIKKEALSTKIVSTNKGKKK